METDSDISGDAVNVASRIEPLAEAGGVCITRQVYDQVQNKLELPLTSLGPKPLKNVTTPVEVFKVVMPWAEGAGPSGPPSLATGSRYFPSPTSAQPPGTNISLTA